MLPNNCAIIGTTGLIMGFLFPEELPWAYFTGLTLMVCAILLERK